MSFAERKTFAATKEDLEQNTADIPVVKKKTGACDSKGTENGGCPGCEGRREDTTESQEDFVTKYNKKSRWTRSCVQHGSGPRTRNRLSSTVTVGATCVYKKGSRVTRCVAFTSELPTGIAHGNNSVTQSNFDSLQFLFSCC